MSRQQLLTALDKVRAPMCDDCLFGPAGYSTRQGVRNAALALARVGQIRRGIGVCVGCGRQKTVSAAASHGSGPLATTHDQPISQRATVGGPHGTVCHGQSEEGALSARSQAPRKTAHLTTSEFGARLGVSSGQVSAWCRDGHLRAGRTGSGRWLIPESEIDRLIQQDAAHRRSFGHKVEQVIYGAWGCSMVLYAGMLIIASIGIIAFLIWLAVSL